MSYEFTPKRPDRAYITNNLVLPKERLNLTPVKAALTFIYGEEEVRDELGELLFTRPKHLKLWDENQHHIIVPREFFDEENYDKFDFEFEDLRPHQFPEVEIEDNIILRDTEQEEALEALTSNYSGTLWLACGKGKSVLALKLAARLGVPTIIVVNSTALLEQWKLEIEKFIGGSVGTVQGKTFDWEHPIVVATVQTLARNRDHYPMRFRRWFGLTLYDEGHHMSAPTFVRSADLFFGRRYSLTATATRTDGLEAVYQHHIGRVIYKNLEQELIPTTFFHRLNWAFDEKYLPRIVDTNGDVHLSRLRTYLGELDWRNQIIYDHLLQDLGDQRQVLVLSHSVPHVERMFEHISLVMRAAGNPHNPGIITGKTPQDCRMNVLRHSNPLFGTFQLAREGLNKPELDALYVVTPFSSDNDAQQAWGRTQRLLAGKNVPLIRVYEDLAFDRCKAACRNIRSRLKRIGYPYQNIKMEVDLGIN